MAFETAVIKLVIKCLFLCLFGSLYRYSGRVQGVGDRNHGRGSNNKLGELFSHPEDALTHKVLGGALLVTLLR